MSAKGEYEILLGIGELLEMYPNLTGNWKKDQDIFTLLWDENKELFENLNVDYEELGE